MVSIVASHQYTLALLFTSSIAGLLYFGAKLSGSGEKSVAPSWLQHTQRQQFLFSEQPRPQQKTIPERNFETEATAAPRGNIDN